MHGLLLTLSLLAPLQHAPNALELREIASVDWRRAQKLAKHSAAEPQNARLRELQATLERFPTHDQAIAWMKDQELLPQNHDGVDVVTVRDAMQVTGRAIRLARARDALALLQQLAPRAGTLLEGAQFTAAGEAEQCEGIDGARPNVSGRIAGQTSEIRASFVDCGGEGWLADPLQLLNSLLEKQGAAERFLLLDDEPSTASRLVLFVDPALLRGVPRSLLRVWISS